MALEDFQRQSDNLFSANDNSIPNTQNAPATNFKSVARDYINNSSDSTPDFIGSNIYTPSIKPARNEALRFDVDRRAIYDRLSDGSYIPRFENYLGSTGNEERLAADQSFIEQAWNGISKNVTKAGVYAFDATAGFAAGIVNAVSEGSLEAFYDNDVSKTFDDWNKQLDYALPNYYTQEERDYGIFAAIPGLGASNFWFNDVAGGAAYVAGSLLPEATIAFFTGGASAPVSIGKSTLQSAGKTLFREGTEELGEAALKNSARAYNSAERLTDAYKIIKGTANAKFAKKSADFAKSTLFLARTSAFEAGIEARANFHDSMDEYFTSFEELNGRQPTFEEASEFTNKARSAANGVFGANMAILGVSNAAMFGKTFGITNKIGRGFGNKLIGLGVEKLDNGLIAVQSVNKAQRLAGNIYKFAGKASVEGLYEEGLQGVASKTTQNYLKTTYDPNSNEAFGVMSALSDAFAEQYGSADGWKEIGIGMIIGQLGGVMQGEGFQGLGRNSRKRAAAELQGIVSNVNSGVESLRGLTNASSLQSFVNQRNSNNEDPISADLAESIINLNYLKSQEGVKSQREIRNDYNNIVNNMQLTDDQIELLGGDEGVASYKQSLINSFETSVNDYKFAKDILYASSFEESTKGMEKGERDLLRSSLTAQFYLGKSSLEKAKQTGQQISNLIGREGIFDAMTFYTGLSEKNQSLVQEYKSKKEEIDSLTNTLTRLGRVNSNSESFQSNAEKLVLAQTRMTELSEELTSIEKSLNTAFQAEKVNVGLDDFSTSLDVDQLVSNFDEVTNYIQTLKDNGKDFEAQSLEYMVGQMLNHSNNYRDMVNTSRQMLSTDFFNTPKGKKLQAEIKGPKYKMSEAMMQAVRDNSELIDSQLRRLGIRTQESVEQQVLNALESNSDLSDREKFKYEAVLRINLGVQSLFEEIKQRAEQEIAVNSEKSPSPSPLQGDTVVLMQKVSTEGQPVTLNFLNETIDKITSQLSYLFDSVNGKKRAELNSQLQGLQKQKEQLLQTLEVESSPEDYNRVIEALNAENRTFEQDILIENYPNFVEAFQQNNLNPLTQIDEKIAQLQNQIDSINNSFDLVSSAQFRRLEQLTYKNVLQGLTTEEKAEIDSLAQEVNDWMLISGVVAGGMRLSDLLRQKAVLEETEVAPQEAVEEIPLQEVVDNTLSDKSSGTYMDLTQNYQTVTVVRNKEGLIEISGISAEAFIEETGIALDFVESLSNDDSTDRYSLNPQNNILITESTKNLVNEVSPIKILATNDKLITNYSVVQKVDAEGNATPLQSVRNTEYLNPISPEAIYESQVGDELTFQIDPNDPYNQELLSGLNRLDFENMSDEQEDMFEQAIDSEQDRLVKGDITIGTLQREIVLLTESAPKRTIKERNDFQNKVAKINGKINKREDVIRTQAEKTVRKQMSQPVSEDQRRSVAEQIVIRVIDSQGRNTGVVKSTRNSAVLSQTDLKMNAIREALVSDESFWNVPDLKNLNYAVNVAKVLPGQPNFIFKFEAGELVTEYRNIQPTELQNIVDIGFVENGSYKSQSRNSDVDMRFVINKKIKGAKIPFIVVQQGNTKVALPVRVQENERLSNEPLEQVFNSDSSTIDKITSLNKLLAERGVDIKTDGFFLVGESNLTRQNLDDKIALINGLSNYSDLNTWLDPSVDRNDILNSQVLTNINLSEPLHSPKIQLDLSEVNNVEIPAKSNSKKSQDKKMQYNNILANKIIPEVNTEIHEQTQTDC